MNHDVNNGRSVAQVLGEMKGELQEFVATRVAMLKSEMREKAKTLKTAVPLAGGAVLLLTTAFFLLSIGFAALVAAVFPNSPYRWCFGFFSIGILWAILGMLAGYFAKREFAAQQLMPTKTIEVLKGDKIWIQSEMKSQI